jgi:DNA-binding PadR family transcriptional regulator
MRVILDLMSEHSDRQPADLIPLSPQVFHILVALAGGDLHGYAIMQEVAARSGGKLRLSPGTLYGSIKRLLEQGAIAELSDRERPAGPGEDERRRYYRLTHFGRGLAKAEAARLAESLEQARVYGLAPELP